MPPRRAQGKAQGKPLLRHARRVGREGGVKTRAVGVEQDRILLELPREAALG